MSKHLLSPPQSIGSSFSLNNWQGWFADVWKAITQGLVISKKSGTLGSAALTSGIATVATTFVTANTLIFLTPITPSAIGTWTVTRTPGTSFKVSSSNGADASTFAYLLVEPV